MNHNLRRRQFLVRASKLFDVGILLVCLLFATFLLDAHVPHIPIASFLGMRIRIQDIAILAVWAICWTWLLSYFKAYKSRRLSTSQSEEVRGILGATSACTLMILITGWLAPIEVVSLRSMMVFWILITTSMVCSRIVIRAILRGLRRRKRNLNHLLIIGTNERAIGMAKRIESNPELGYCVVGFVDETWALSPRFERSGYSVVCDFDRFSDYINEHVVDEVIIFLPVRSMYERSCRIVAQCEEQGITVRFVPDFFSPVRGHFHEDSFVDQLVVTVDGTSFRGPAMFVKRLIDVLASALALAVLSPVLAVIAITIRMDSPGPALFVQERVGLNKRRFRFFKFRTMVDGAERRLAELESRNEASGPVFKIKHDPRLTRVGPFLRRTSLDELPQLINVLLGDMSLVGPRPLPVRDYQGFSQDWHRRRFSVRPGITCFWQILGRSEIPFERWMELDMQYIDHWSLALDLRILFKTMQAVLRGSGAH